MRLVVKPNGPPNAIAAAPSPILGSFSFRVFPILVSLPSSPNNDVFKLSLLLAKPTADPTIIPAIGPPGINGNRDVIPPTIAPLAIFGKYLFTLFTIFLEIRPEPSLPLVPSSLVISLPNKKV